MKIKRILPLLLIAFACRQENPPAVNDSGFVKDEQAWRTRRVQRLTAPDGWLSLVGLFWLADGPNDIGLPSHPPSTAHLVLQNGSVTLAPNPAFTIDGKPVTAPVALRDDSAPQGPTVVQAGTLSFLVHAVAGRFAIRAKDPQSEARTHFRGLQYFPLDAKYRLEARFERYDPPKKIPFGNVSGVTTEEISPGALVFTVDGREFRLDPILEEGTKDLFIVFKDLTSGRETYGATRFLYAPPPGPDGRTVVDFNRAYNPPCAFTPFATCPLPPPQNRLPIRIEAGELKYAGGH